MTVPPDLTALPLPAVIQEPSFEAILSRMQADAGTRLPSLAPVLELETSVANILLETAAYGETLLRARVNDAARSDRLAYATGADLDHVGANSSPAVTRMPGEDDERFRQRILLATMARNAGSEERYRLIAMSTDLTVKDAIVYRVGRDPTIHVALLSTAPDGVAGAGLIDAVTVALNDPSNRVVNGTFVVVSAVTSIVNITATLTLLPNAPVSTTLAAAENALRTAWAAEGGLGRDITRDWVKARLMAAGSVYGVALGSPAVDIIVHPNEAASIGTVTLSASASTGQ